MTLRDHDDDDEHDEDAPVDDRLDERELPDESDVDDSDETDLIECPYCRKSIADGSEWCHHCGKYISHEEAPLRLPFWVLIGVVLAGLVLLMWIVP